MREIRPLDQAEVQKQARLASESELEALDGPAQERFDCLTRLAAQTFSAPFASISFIDEGRERSSSQLGLKTSGVASDRSFCARAVESDAVFVVEDAAADSRFRESPLVNGPPHVRFYAGAPIRAVDGRALGALGVFDSTPRAFSPSEAETLIGLASLVLDVIEAGRRRRELSEYEPITQAFTRIQTARRDAEAALRASDVKNRTVLDNIVDGIITIDQTGRVLDYNRACVEIFGYSPEETTGQNIRMLMPQGDRERHDGYITAYQQTGRKKIIGIGRKVEGRRKDGSTFPVQLSVSEVVIDGAPHYTGIVRDISLEKKSEQALRDSEERFALAAQGASVGIWDWIDVNADRQWWSPIFYELLGQSVGAPSASLKNFRRLLHPDDREPTFKAIEAHLDHGAPFRLEFRLQHKTKGHRWFLGSAVASGDEDGRPRRMTGSIMDIHELKLTQEVLQRRSDTLERANRELDHFAYIASHDLRAPLRGMDNVAQWIEEDLAEDASDNVREKLRLLRGRVARMDKLLTDILAFSRAGKQESAPEPVDCPALLSEIIGWIDPPYSFTLQTKGMPEQLYVSRTLLEQVLMNLVANAVKHHHQSGGLITIQYREHRGFHEFVVEDDGPGIPRDYHDRVFGMFQTLKSRDQVEGSGIGLAIVKKMVETSGGSIWLRSPLPAGGSAFHFTLPCIQHTAETSDDRRPRR